MEGIGAAPEPRNCFVVLWFCGFVERFHRGWPRAERAESEEAREKTIRPVLLVREVRTGGREHE